MHVAKFSHAGQHVLSGGDDRKIKLWDISTGLAVCEREAHGDYVRCASPSGASSQGWATGGFDHRVRLWDLRAASSSSSSSAASSSSSSASSSSRSGGPTLDLDHGHPVSAIQYLRGGSLIASAGGPEVKVWDLVAGGRLLCSLKAHQKGVTSLALDGTGSRLLSGSLDGTIASYSLSDFSITHRMRHAAPVLSLAVSQDNSALAIGGEDGSLALRRRVARAEEKAEERGRLAIIRGGTQRFFLRGKGAEARADDMVVQGQRKPQLQAYEVLLKRFEYGAALDAALQQGNPLIASSLLAELARRGGLRAALSGRDDAELVPVLAFITRYVAHPRYSSSMQTAAHVVLDLYAPAMGRAPAVDRLFAALYSKLESEIKLEQELLRLQGAVEALLGAHAAGALEGVSGGVEEEEEEEEE